MTKHVAVLFVLVTGFAFQVHAQSDEDISKTFPNFHTILDGQNELTIYSGSRPVSADDIAVLNSKGIKTVIDLEGGDLVAVAPHFLGKTVTKVLDRVVSWNEPGETPAGIAAEQSSISAAGMNFISMPLNSLNAVNGDEAATIDQILQLLDDPKNSPVFLHCNHGLDRTGLVIALFKTRYLHTPACDAYTEMLEHGHNLTHIAFTSGMDRYFWRQMLNLMTLESNADFQQCRQIPSILF